MATFRYIPQEASQFDAHATNVVGQLLSSCAQGGYTPEEIEVAVRVTDLSDHQVEIVHRKIRAAGLAKITLLDERSPARPGTVTESALSPAALALMDQTSAMRRDGDAQH